MWFVIVLFILSAHLIAEEHDVSQKNQESLELIEAQIDAIAHSEEGPVEKRLELESFSDLNPYVITPFKPNYAIFSYITEPNNAPYKEYEQFYNQIKHEELEFQLSLRFELWDNIWHDKGRLQFAFTTHAFWQAFNDDVSAPFRETNYSPEIILTFDSGWNILGFKNIANSFIINHQSNGKSEWLSRSWNRLMLNTIFEKGDYVSSLTVWHRLKENKKRYDGDPNGDDNPDILKYLGYFEWIHLYKYHHSTFALKLNSNLGIDDNKTSFDLSFSYPIKGKLLFYAKYFNGYGRSLIDYNGFQQALSLGFALNDWL